ncbi:TPA: NADH-quinone oxidoreductase subunit NuoF [Candidatus Scatousia excrementigallinarum]|uniref:NADH-quinone oxidoreductase subunit NuoF n=1 Tax=Candidatus Scatousia excrementigallinarum TaxID=2840935 RepID=A0A9D1EZH1_9BACT|nr:NADH-quinone oxidoreductase subunit NuoF [Candidatus Scatousia excrementigallinarum]
MEKTALNIDIKQEQLKAQEEIKKQGLRVLVCAGTGCVANGSMKVIEKFAELGADVSVLTDYDKMTIVPTGCHGFCEQGVLVIIPDKDVTYVKVKVEDVEEIYESHIKNNKPVERLLYTDPKTHEHVHKNEDINFYAKQTRTALANCGHINAECIDEAIAVRGYEALANVIEQNNPDAVIEEIEKSGLRGRGGGGFPTGRKWRFTAANKGGKSYVVCNGDEGDPGAFMDRSIMEGDPHKLLEGMAIAAFAIGADEGYIYVRAEYPLAIKRLRKAIADAEERHFLGKNIMGSDFSFTLHIKEGAGAFVCGEETALIASIEGERGMPRPKPPFPANKGLFGRPTLINNVETLANVPVILLKGADWFASFGTETSKGTKTFALTGEVNNTGLIEVPMGTTLREIVFDIGGGIRGGKKFKAVQIGGPSGGCLTEEHLDLPMDYDSLIKAGAMVGSGGLVVMAEDTCIVEVARFFMNFTQHESCGKCVPCREGSKNMLKILEKIVAGKGEMKDLDLLEELALSVKEGSLCGLGKTAPNPVLSTLKYFRDEYIAHIKDKKCPAGVCTAMKKIVIQPELCKGCTKCARTCPVGAIEGTVKQPHHINQEKCIKCEACLTNCPFRAIVLE